MSEENLTDDAVEAAGGHDPRRLPLGMGEALRPLHGSTVDFATRTAVAEQSRALFEQSPTDLAVAQVVPIFDGFKDWWAPVELQAEFVRANPGRAWLCGGADPMFAGLDAALEHLEWQIRDLGAVSMKFYNGHVERSWRCDDRELAYPLYERAAELGVRVLQFHKGFPFGLENIEDVRPNDLQRPARDFPEIDFVIHHLGVPYFEETVYIAARFPNVHLCLGANLAFTPIAPRQVQEQLGRLLAGVGVDKLSYASEGFLAGPPWPYLKAFLELEIPQDLREGYGWPQITREDKRKVLGQNMARLLGIDLDAKVAELGLRASPLGPAAPLPAEGASPDAPAGTGMA
jgi:hypothetical protein